MNAPDHVLIDAHTHVYDCYRLGRFLDVAAGNFSAAAGRLGYAGRHTGVLLLADPAGQHGFARFAAGARELAGTGWSVHATDETGSLYCRADDGRGLFVIAGRQIITAERLEVLALACEATFADGRPLIDTVQDAGAQGALTVVAWGVGKWLGRRGALIDTLLATPGLGAFFLGDNGGRPVFWPRPRAFQRARLRGIGILAGSDPFPFARDVTRVGSYGVVLPGSITPARPAQSLRRILADPALAPLCYGRRVGPLRFLYNQLRLSLQ